MTYRESKYVAARINGATKQDAAKAAGFSVWLARNPSQMIETEEMRAQIETLTAELTESTIQAGLIDATEIHEYLSDALRADSADIKNDDHSYKPLSDWPEIWRRMVEGGDVDVEYASERSHDGEDKDGAGGWDRTGTIVKVKFKFASKVKLLELAMRHKGVNAMVEQKAGDVNITFVTAEKARQVGSAKKRLEKVIDVKT